MGVFWWGRIVVPYLGANCLGANCPATIILIGNASYGKITVTFFDMHFYIFFFGLAFLSLSLLLFLLA